MKGAFEQHSPVAMEQRCGATLPHFLCFPTVFHCVRSFSYPIRPLSGIIRMPCVAVGIFVFGTENMRVNTAYKGPLASGFTRGPAVGSPIAGPGLPADRRP